MPICPAGHLFTIEKMILKEDEYLIPEMILKTRCEHCEQCTMKTQCTKAKNGRGMEINLTYEAQKSKVRKLLDSDEGKQIMSNRSSQSEGGLRNPKRRL